MEGGLHMKETKDIVNSPSHYLQNKFESIDEMVILFGVQTVISFCKCNAWKYRSRAFHKGDPQADNKKADFKSQRAGGG